MTALVRYEAARTALAEAHRVDEVKDIRDKAEAMAAYARQAKDQELILWATEIKVRAERRAGALLSGMAQSGERSTHETGHLHRASNTAIVGDEEKPKTLAELGVSANQSSHWQQLASMSDEHFEAAVTTAKETAGQVTTAFMLREAQRAKPQGRPQTGPKAEAIREELRAAKERGVSMLETYARLTLTAVRSQDSFTDQERSLLDELTEAIAAATA